MIRPLTGILASLDPATRASLMLLGMIAGFLNYEGLVAASPAASDSFWWKCSALIAAIAVCTVLMVFWAYALAIIPSLVNRPAHLIAGVLLVAAFAPLIFFMSATWNAAFLAKSESERLNIERAAQGAGEAVSAFGRRVTMAGELLVDLRALQAYLSNLAQREETDGAVSGDRRCSTVCNALKGQAAAVATLIASAEASQRDSAAKVASAEQALARLTALPTAPGGDTPPLARALALMAEINAHIAGAGESGLAGTMGRTVSTLGDTVIAPPGVSPRQRLALDNIRQAVAQRAAPIEKRAQELAALPPMASISFTPDNALRSAFRYHESLLSQWAIGIGVDVLPFFLLIYRIIAAHAVAQDARDPVRGVARLWTVDQLLEGQALFERVGRLTPIAPPNSGPPVALPQPLAPTPAPQPGGLTATPGKRRGRPRKNPINGAGTP